MVTLGMWLESCTCAGTGAAGACGRGGRGGGTAARVRHGHLQRPLHLPPGEKGRKVEHPYTHTHMDRQVGLRPP